MQLYILTLYKQCWNKYVQLLMDCQNFFFFYKGAMISIFLSETIFIYFFLFYVFL